MSGRAEWHGRADFAEFAEALGVTTEEVMAAMATPAGSALVLYSPGVSHALDPSTLVKRATLARDEGGVYRVQHEQQVGTLGDFRARMEELMIEYQEEQR